MTRQRFQFQLAGLLMSAVGFGSITVAADEAHEEAKRATRLEAMRELAQQTRVEIAGDEAPTPQLVPRPVFSYSDQPRRIFDATLWLWTAEGRPVALQKLEAGIWARGVPEWTFCFASLSESRLRVTWPNGKTYNTTQPGVEYRPVPKATAPAESAAVRRRQMRSIARRFSATIDQGPVVDEVEQMRLLPRPIVEFGEEESSGAIFGLTANGTNPDAYLILEASLTDDGAREWRYGLARMTTGGLQVRLDGTEVWSVPYVPPRPIPYDTWTFFYEPRNEE